MAMQTILIINGPNLNMLGLRDPALYGSKTLDDIQQLCADTAADLDLRVHCRQSNYEGEIVTWLQEAAARPSPYAGVILNAGAYTHTSIAIHDALELLAIPLVEVHLSDPDKREAFRHTSFVTPLAAAVYKGFGPDGYVKAIHHVANLIHTA